MIRIATENDAEELLNIYAPYVEKTAITFEYEVPSVEEFRTRIRNILKISIHCRGKRGRNFRICICRCI